MLQILYNSGGLFATKMDIKRPFEIRIVAKFSTFYGKYGHFPHRFTHFFFVADIPSEKKRSQLNKNEGGGRLTTVYKIYKKKRCFGTEESLPKT